MTKLSGVKVEGHKGTWYELNRAIVDGKELYLLEHEKYGQDAAGLIINASGAVVLDDVHNGWDDYEDAFGSTPTVVESYELELYIGQGKNSRTIDLLDIKSLAEAHAKAREVFGQKYLVEGGGYEPPKVIILYINTGSGSYNICLWRTAEAVGQEMEAVGH